MEHFQFLAAAVKDRNIGALMPTSQASVRHICSAVDRHRPVTVVEYGPGTGVFTKFLLHRLHPESLVLAIELNREFARGLRLHSFRRRVRRPRLVVANDDARRARELLGRLHRPHADYVLSGIPFSFLPDEVKREIVRETFDALAPDGAFIVYQYSFAMRPFLKEAFPHVLLGRTILNFPPLCIMQARKTPRAASEKRPRRVPRRPTMASEFQNALKGMRKLVDKSNTRR